MLISTAALYSKLEFLKEDLATFITIQESGKKEKKLLNGTSFIVWFVKGKTIKPPMGVLYQVWPMVKKNSLIVYCPDLEYFTR